MFKSLCSPYLTRALMGHLEELAPPDPSRICKLLNRGAGPWAVAPPAAEDIPGRSLVYLLSLRAPHAECMDAWFDRVGTIQGEPWKKSGTPNPFHEWVEHQPQSPMFIFQLIGRLFQAGLQPTAPEDQPIGPWLQRHCGEEFAHMLRMLHEHRPAVLLDSNQWTDAQIHDPAHARFFAQISKAHLEMGTDEVSAAAAPAPRF